MSAGAMAKSHVPLGRLIQDYGGSGMTSWWGLYRGNGVPLERTEVPTFGGSWQEGGDDIAGLGLPVVVAAGLEVVDGRAGVEAESFKS